MYKENYGAVSVGTTAVPYQIAPQISVDGFGSFSVWSRLFKIETEINWFNEHLK